MRADNLGDAVLGVLVGIVEFIASLFEIPDPPEFLSADGDSYVSQFSGWLSQASAWVPWPTFTQCLVAWVACVTAGIVIRIIKVVSSYMTAGGGGY